MPWHVAKSDQCSEDMPYAVIKDDDGSVDRVDLTALITCDHAGRHTGSAHQHYEGGRIVLAEAPAALEQERIHGIAIGQQWGFESVDERLPVEVLEHGIDKVPVARRLATPGSAPFPRSRIVVIRQA